MEIVNLLSFVEFIGDVCPEAIHCNFNSNYGFSRCIGRGVNLTQIKHQLCASKYTSNDEFISKLRMPFIQKIQFFNDRSREFDVLDEIATNFNIVRFLEFKQTRKMLMVLMETEISVIQSLKFSAKWTFQSGPIPTICITDIVFKLEQNLIKSYDEFKSLMSRMLLEYIRLFDYLKNEQSKHVLNQLADFFKEDFDDDIEDDHDEEFEHPQCSKLSDQLRQVISDSLLETFWQKSDLTLSFESWKDQHNDSKSEDILYTAWRSSQPFMKVSAYSKSFTDVSRKRFNQELERVESHILKSDHFNSGGKVARFNNCLQKYKNVDWIERQLSTLSSSSPLSYVQKNHQFHFFRRLYTIVDLEFEQNQHLCDGNFDRYLKKRQFDFGCMLRNEFEQVNSELTLNEFLKRKMKTFEDIEFKQFSETSDLPESERFEQFKEYLLDFERNDNEVDEYGIDDNSL